MARDRFHLIFSIFHFSDNEKQMQGDWLQKVYDIFNKFLAVFQESFTPLHVLCDDVSLVLFIGRLRCKQYIKTERYVSGIKLYLHSNYETGYVLKSQVYRVKDTNSELSSDTEVSGLVVTICSLYVIKVTQFILIIGIPVLHYPCFVLNWRSIPVAQCRVTGKICLF
jgi:hypothetical protein